MFLISAYIEIKKIDVFLTDTAKVVIKYTTQNFTKTLVYLEHKTEMRHSLIMTASYLFCDRTRKYLGVLSVTKTVLISNFKKMLSEKPLSLYLTKRW